MEDKNIIIEKKRTIILIVVISILFACNNFLYEFKLQSMQKDLQLEQDRLSVLQDEFEELRESFDYEIELVKTEVKDDIEKVLKETLKNDMDNMKEDILAQVREDLQIKKDLEEKQQLEKAKEQQKKTNDKQQTLKRSEELEKDGKKFVYYRQTDPKWASIKYSWINVKNAGCGPTALAMILNYLSDEQITPYDTVMLSKENKLDQLEPPRTNMPELLKIATKKYGVNYSVIDKEQIIDELKAGKTVMVATHKNPLINYKSSGHYLVLRGLDKHGNIIVNDPYPMNTYDKPADSSVEGYKNKYVYVTTPEHLYKELFEVYSFWD